MIPSEEYIIEPYSGLCKDLWDRFVDASRNATFILRRDFMDYHSDRFTDRSLIIRRANGSKAGQTVALFAACEAMPGQISAHAGLTYGGLLLPYSGVDGDAAVTILRAICNHYHYQGYTKLIYKAIPHIYHRYPAEEDVYALFRCGATLIECNISSTILLQSPIRFNENSRRNLSRAVNNGLSVSRSSDFGEFWPILEELLDVRYNTRPVHSLSEISLLAERFPDNIQLFLAHDTNGKPVAGTVLFVTPSCVHAQYIGASTAGKELGALPLIFRSVIDSDLCAGSRYFDFGISTENHGRTLNSGLLRQKNGMGGRATTYNIFEIDL